ncbi:MAG: hypothetical protein A3G18_11135 [Rhodospirillales bacterium RIFCSPLOWO2_12_FULL_58_28]|nr:MAG: hypothetical protein A3H92_10280 [Rhodospirillales bacterium RIFCSPLOWO2_02_FULL_58_16]OHC77752.1 MAG: hypothetical protein A3G18_11135 [Rhodospirillales bacterium RIFCSPLOWO2_12_FULL_58_28]
MRFQGREISPNRSTAIDLRDERALIEEGYELLDEKRMQLAGELLRRLDRYRKARTDYGAIHDEAGRMLAHAGGRHGLEGLFVYPALDMAETRLNLKKYRFLGVETVDAGLTPAAPVAASDDAVNPSPEARHTARLFAELIASAAELAGLHLTLNRLAEEYRETERRARALENVLLPEIAAAIKEIVEYLEETEQEEAVTVHRAANRIG